MAATCLLALSFAPSLLSPTLVQPHAAAHAAPTMSQPAPSSSSRWSRRQLVPAVAAWAAASRFAPSARAADDGKAKIWTSGRSDPIRPTNKDKADGTKKDPKYLGCLNDCVPLCTSSYAAETGKPKERSDCFEECQDQCCSTCASPRERSHGPPHSAQPQLSYSHSSAARPQLSLISASPPCSGVHPRPTQVPAVHVRHPKVTLRRPAGHSGRCAQRVRHKWGPQMDLCSPCTIGGGSRSPLPALLTAFGQRFVKRLSVSAQVPPQLAAHRGPIASSRPESPCRQPARRPRTTRLSSSSRCSDGLWWSSSTLA